MKNKLFRGRNKVTSYGQIRVAASEDAVNKEFKFVSEVITSLTPDGIDYNVVIYSFINKTDYLVPVKLEPVVFRANSPEDIINQLSCLNPSDTMESWIEIPGDEKTITYYSRKSYEDKCPLFRIDIVKV